MGMGLSGLASGFDWKSMVDQLIEVSRAPQNRMRSEQSKNSSKTNAINEIKPNFISNYMSVMSKVVNNQLSLIKTIDKVNFVLTNTDGFSTKPRNVQVSISGTSNVDKTSKNANTTYEEMVNDMTTLGTDLSEYYNQIFVDNNRLVEKDWNSSYTFSLEINEGIESARLMNAMYQEILNNKEKITVYFNKLNTKIIDKNNQLKELNLNYKKEIKKIFFHKLYI